VKSGDSSSTRNRRIQADALPAVEMSDMLGNLWLRSIALSVLGRGISGIALAVCVVIGDENRGTWWQLLAAWSLIGIVAGVAGGLAVGVLAGVPASLIVGRFLNSDTRYGIARLIASMNAAIWPTAVIGAAFAWLGDGGVIGWHLVISSSILGGLLGSRLVGWIYRQL
jgi:hypothetical protein